MTARMTSTSPLLGVLTGQARIVRFDVPSEPLEVSYGDPNAFEVKP